MPYYALYVLLYPFMQEFTPRHRAKTWSRRHATRTQTRNCECQCEQLATASSLTRNCELGRFDHSRDDVAAAYWTKRSTRICEWCCSQLRAQADQNAIYCPLAILWRSSYYLGFLVFLLVFTCNILERK